MTLEVVSSSKVNGLFSTIPHISSAKALARWQSPDKGFLSAPEDSILPLIIKILLHYMSKKDIVDTDVKKKVSKIHTLIYSVINIKN